MLCLRCRNDTSSHVHCFFYCFTAFLLSTADADPCLASYEVTINDGVRANRNVFTMFLDTCDFLIEHAWDMFSSLGSIATSYPDLPSCGKLYPIWMDDVLPSANATTTVEICLNIHFSYCLETWSLQVKNCQSFYVYELTPSPICPSTPCFDAEATNQTNTTSSFSDITNSSSPSIQADIPQAGITLGELLGVVIVIMLVVAVHVAVMIVCHKITTKNRIHAAAQVDPHHDVPMQAGIKVEGLPA